MNVRTHQFLSKQLSDISVVINSASTSTTAEAFEGSSYELDITTGAECLTSAGEVRAQISEFRAAYSMSLSLQTRSINLDLKELTSRISATGSESVSTINITGGKRLSSISYEQRNMIINQKKRHMVIQHGN